jgi:hypothetical protein
MANPERSAMQYALLVYATIEDREAAGEDERRTANTRIQEVLDRPEITGWVRLRDPETATTVRAGRSAPLLSDGPFVDSKEFLGGLIVVEAHDLDRALAVAAELQEIRGAGAIEVRPARGLDLDAG